MRFTFSGTGRVAGDGEMKFTSTKQKVLVFTVCENLYNKKGEQIGTNYWKMELWDDKADKWEPYIKKGQLLELRGNLNQSRFTPQGSSHEVTKVVGVPTEILPLVGVGKTVFKDDSPVLDQELAAVAN